MIKIKKKPKYEYTYATAKEERPIRYAHSAAFIAEALFLTFTMAYQSCITVPSPFNHIVVVLGMLACGIIVFFKTFKGVPKIVPHIPQIIALIVFLACNPKTIYGGLLGIINEHLTLWNLQYDDGKALFKSSLISDFGENALTVIIALLIISLICVLIDKKNTWLTLVFIAISFLPSMALGKLNAFAFALALTVLNAMIMEKMQSADFVRRIAWTLVFGVVVCSFSLIFGGTQSKTIEKFKENQKLMMDTIRFGTDSLPQGDLRKADEMLDGNDSRLIVTSEFGRDLYLRGYVGANYSNGEWTPLKTVAYGTGKSSILQWLENKGFSPVFQYSSYLQNDTQKFETNNISIQNVGARRNYLYTPYSTDPFDNVGIYQNKDSNIKSSAAFGAKSYSFSEKSDRRPAELFTLGEWYLNATEQSEKDYVKDETVYRNFVYKNYLSPNENTKNIIYNIFWADADESDSDNLLSAIQHIRSVSEERYKYTEFPDYVKNGNDPLVDFLTQYGKGNSVLYTSAAVEALKIAGYPARYAEGYYMENGRSLHEEVILTTKNAHAWAEVYMDGIGWLPVDFTPGFYYDTYSLISLVDASRQSQRVNKDGNNSKDNVNLNNNGDGKKNKTPEEKKHDIYVTIGIFVGIFVLCVIIFFITELLRYIKIALLRKRIESADEKEKQAMICKVIVELLRIDGIDASLGKSPDDAADKINLKHSAFSQSEYKRVHQIVEKYKYGEVLLEPYEKQILVKFCEKYADSVQSNPFKRMKLLSKIKIK